MPPHGYKRSPTRTRSPTGFLIISLRARAIGTDLSDSDGAHKLGAKVREIVGDRLDILVANAGVSKAATIEATTLEDFNTLFAVNARALR